MNVRRFRQRSLICSAAIMLLIASSAAHAGLFGHKANRPKDLKTMEVALADEIRIDAESLDLDRYTLFRRTVTLVPMQRELSLYLSSRGDLVVPVYQGGGEYPWEIQTFKFAKKKVSYDLEDSRQQALKSLRAEKVEVFGVDRWLDRSRPVNDNATRSANLFRALGMKSTRVRDTTYILPDPACYIRVRYFSDFVERSENNFYVKQGWDPQLYVDDDVDVEISVVAAKNLDDIFALLTPSFLDLIERLSTPAASDSSEEEMWAKVLAIGAVAFLAKKAGDWLREVPAAGVGLAPTEVSGVRGKDSKVEDEGKREPERASRSDTGCIFDVTKGSIKGVLVVECADGRERAYRRNENGKWEVAGGASFLPAFNFFDSIEEAAKTWCNCK